MISKPALVVLVVCAMLVADADCWRRRRRFVRAVTNKVKSYVAGKVVGAAVAAVGKRDALCADELTAEQVQELANDIQTTCADIPVDLALDGLNFEEVKGVFEESDADGDGKLLDAELASFSASIQTVEACAEAESDNQP